MDKIQQTHEEVLALFDAADELDGRCESHADRVAAAETAELLSRVEAVQRQHAALRAFALAWTRTNGGPDPQHGSQHGYTLARLAKFLRGAGEGCWEWEIPEAADELLNELPAESNAAIELLREESPAKTTSAPPPPPLPPTEQQQFEAYCLDRYLAGDTHKEVWVNAKSHPQFGQFGAAYTETSIRGPIRRAALRRGIELQSRQPGRPKSSRNCPKA